MTNVWRLFRYVAYVFASKKLRSATIESRLSAIKIVYRISRDFELDTTHPVIARARKGAARSHIEVDNQATVRRPVSLAMLLAGETLIPAKSNGGRVLWLGLNASLLFSTRSSEIFAETLSRTHETYCFWRADVILFRGRAQLAVPQ